MNWRRYEQMEQFRTWLMGHRIHLGVLIVLVLDIVLLVAGYEPLRWAHSRMDANLAAWTHYAQDLKAAESDWEQALARLRTARADRQKILTDSFLSESTGYQTIRTFIERTALRSGVVKRDINYKNKTLRPMGLVELGLSNPISGSYEQVRNYIQAIENADRFIILESIDLQSTGKKGIIDVKINMRTYFTKSTRPETAS